MKKLTTFALLSLTLLLRADPALRLVSPAEGETVPLLSDEQKSYLDMERADRVKAFADAAYRRTMASWGYYPKPVRLAWEWNGNPELRTVFTVLVYRLPDRTPVFLADTAERTATLDNLEIARTYGWEVRARALGATKEVATGTFRTEDHAPRLIRVGGVPNVRDLGGRLTLDGRRVRQGMVIRTAGLNDNAAPLYYTPEELAEMDASGEIRARIKEYEAATERWRSLEKKPDTLRLVTCPVSRKWTVFRVGEDLFKAHGDVVLRNLTSIPGELLGAAAETLEADSSGKVSFPEAAWRKAAGPAVFLQEVEADGDGWFSIGCGADWFWDLRLDGEVVFDRSAGNGNAEKSASDWLFPVPVTKGRHILAAVVRTGSEGWVWSCVGAPPAPRTALIGTMLKNARDRLDSATRVRKGTVFGRNRPTEQGRAVLLDTIGMRSDIDLRSDRECEGMTGSPLGPTVTWFHISSSAYAGMQSQVGREAFTAVFRVFLDERNYPIDFHCIAGQDRTGAVAFIVNGLLGVPEEELYRDWESTGYWNRDASFCHARLFDKLVAGFDRWPGETINQRIEAYVLSLGFTAEDIAHLRELLLEPADLMAVAE